METEEQDLLVEGQYPIFFIPKICTDLETNCDMAENVFIHLNVTSPDIEGNETIIYKGLCNVKVIDGNDINVRYSFASNETSPILLTEANQITFPSYTESEVWMNPSTSPYVYNRCRTPPIESYTITEGPDNHITIEQHNTYITQNVYNYNDHRCYSPATNNSKIVQVTDQVTNLPIYNSYENEEYECGVFLSQLAEGLLNENDIRDRKFVGLNTENEALKQLMSTDIQSVSRQQKTILFLGHDSGSAQTIQNISINDPTMECSGSGGVPKEIVVDNTNSTSVVPTSKKYQCNKCKNIFEQLSAFKHHMVGKHRQYNPYDIGDNISYMCSHCGKQLKSLEKFEQHCLRHGNPDLECNKCHKVFASKFTLRNHRKIHSRMFPCAYCVKSYSTAPELYSHSAKAHSIFICKFCSFTCVTETDLSTHEQVHVDENNYTKDCGKSDVTDEMFSEMSAESVKCEDDQVQQADSVIAKVKSNKFFRAHSQSIKKNSRFNKICNVCYKKFDRIGDLKRHLIEHVIKSTLAKNPVNSFGVLNIRCEICQEKVFNKIDRYKAHLREHAKLTLYKCTFCDKSFSDSSNFSKHKKIHGSKYFQCDICSRKFNSKKMITQHIEYHNKNRPMQCRFCDKVFHFESMLNKHIKSSHNKEASSKFKCRFCEQYFKSLKEKWDHEWKTHNVRKFVVDCLVCGSRFRKYTELKKHCIKEHDTIIPSAKRLLKWKAKNKLKLIEGQD